MEELSTAVFDRGHGLIANHGRLKSSPGIPKSSLVYLCKVIPTEVRDLFKQGPKCDFAVYQW